MADSWTREQRSRVMSRNKNKGNKSTEVTLRMRLISRGISGWRMNCKDVLGKPDFVFHERKLAIFVDGCFWHGCSIHRTIPQANHEFWQKKINGNISRDIRVRQSLEADGWTVLRFWEHDIRENIDSVLDEIISKLSDSQACQE